MSGKFHLSGATAGTNELQCALGVADMLPAGSLGKLSDVAKQLGTNLLALLLWLWNHSDVLNAIIADIQAGNWQKAIADLIAAWNSSQPKTA